MIQQKLHLEHAEKIVHVQDVKGAKDAVVAVKAAQEICLLANLQMCEGEKQFSPFLLEYL